MIEARARDLGRLIGQSDEYRALKRANGRLMEDADLKRSLHELETVAGALEEAGRRGVEPPKDQVERYERLVGTVQASPLYQGVVAAQANFDKLMARVNAEILEGIRSGAASPIISLG